MNIDLCHTSESSLAMAALSTPIKGCCDPGECNDDGYQTPNDDETNPIAKRLKSATKSFNIVDSFESPISTRKMGKKKIFTVTQDDRFMENIGGLSPITEISINLSGASLEGAQCGDPQQECIKNNKNLKKENVKQNRFINRRAHTDFNESLKTTNRLDGEGDGIEHKNLNLTMSRSGCGLRNSHRVNIECSPSKLNSMTVDELSFYDEADQEQRAFTASPEMMGLLLPEGSPQRFQISRSQGATAKYHQQPKSSLKSKLHSIEGYLDDGNSVDSAYEASLGASCTLDDKQVFSAKSSTAPSKSLRIFHSLSSESMESSIDDEYMELLEMESLDEQQHLLSEDMYLPSDLNSLISAQIKSEKTTMSTMITTPKTTTIATPEMKKPSVRRCLSLVEGNQQIYGRHVLKGPNTPEILRATVPETSTTPYLSKFSASPSSSYNRSCCFKRPDPPSTATSPIQRKRFCSIDEKENNSIYTTKTLPSASPNRPALRHCVSMNDAQIMTALARSDNKGEPDLIGDFSKPFCLPLVNGRHRDLKSISSETVASLINGQFEDSVASYKIIDCRYPYEFEGGHIRGAKNLYTQEQIVEEFLNHKTEPSSDEADAPKRNILVFHCEFSSERGPKLSRFLRNNDRERNTNSYPALEYPEIYLLHNGYKEFFETHAELCDPVAYRPMLEPSYSEAYKHFRAKSKSWNGDVKGLGGATSRLKKSRSRLVL